MINIRRKVFETNSSSTHSICICSEKEYEMWNANKVYLNESYISSESIFAKKNFVTRDEVIDIYSKSKRCQDVAKILVDLDDEAFEKEIRNEDFYTCDNYFSDYLEDFVVDYETKAGEKIVAFGQYGFDG